MSSSSFLFLFVVAKGVIFYSMVIKLNLFSIAGSILQFRIANIHSNEDTGTVPHSIYIVASRRRRLTNNEHTPPTIPKLC